VGVTETVLLAEAVVLGVGGGVPDGELVSVGEPVEVTVPVCVSVGDTEGDCELDDPSEAVPVDEGVGDGVPEAESVGLTVPLLVEVPDDERVTVAVAEAVAANTQPPPFHANPIEHTGRDARRVQCAPAAPALP
jgi:hypothetical protein